VDAVFPTLSDTISFYIVLLTIAQVLQCS